MRSRSSIATPRHSSSLSNNLDVVQGEQWKNILAGFFSICISGVGVVPTLGKVAEQGASTSGLRQDRYPAVFIKSHGHSIQSTRVI
ncbi:hypothetical protein BOTBODRAFT_31529 [Botryobasidium botryosum FD-172 SS1]|uniref:Uncharacterized protein n=1 Tax=Botryobasidium botryosum (strain FD-172 SS1) TaxID=930990 RepID=A0A067MUT1_BOTB1|nr:hypothetical protein BOTBODRAFT_31529 [Botryobasidium botryosum FD-172 SS1]